MKYTLVVAYFAAAVYATADCPPFADACKSACSTAKLTANTQCNDFSASCSCNGTVGDMKDKGSAFCNTQKEACSQTCSLIDSFSCDQWSLNAQCMCRSFNSMKGGEMKGGNETACSDLRKKCREDICKGKKVVKNICASPSNATCQCEGGNPKNPNDKNNNEGELGNAGIRVLGSAATLIVTIGALLLV